MFEDLNTNGNPPSQPEPSDEVIHEAVEAAIRMARDDAGYDSKESGGLAAQKEVLHDLIAQTGIVVDAAKRYWRPGLDSGLRVEVDKEHNLVKFGPWVGHQLYTVDASKQFPVIDRYDYTSGANGKEAVYVQTLNPADGTISEGGTLVTDPARAAAIFSGTLKDFHAFAELIPKR